MMINILGKRYFKIMIALFTLLCSLNMIEDTYAKYMTSASANTNIAISRWNIKINTQDVQNNSNFTNSIIPTFNGNQYTAADIIAPGSEGTFDITIDGTYTDVAYNVSLALSVPQDSSVQDLVITKYTIGDSPTEYQYTNTITYQVGLNDTKVKTFHFFIKWDDNALTETMDNQDDTEAAYSEENALMSVSVNITQATSSN